jgi:2-polyprenyl-3-methyl-5-hydroxy-6-metoxy-1,4-benzoquinol methylase
MPAISLTQWKGAQEFERSWWVGARDQHPIEIEKSFYVAQLLRISEGSPNATVIDVGSGPLSLLLRVPVKAGTALDPIHFGDLELAYRQRGIARLIKPAEELSAADGRFDEAWIYNCLQHVIDPELILQNVMRSVRLVRLFEWVYMRPYQGHPHELTPQMLQQPFQKAGWSVLLSRTNFIDVHGLHGNYFVGIFSK